MVLVVLLIFYSLKNCQMKKEFGYCRQSTDEEVTPDLDLADLNLWSWKGLGRTEGEGRDPVQIRQQERKC